MALLVAMMIKPRPKLPPWLSDPQGSKQSSVPEQSTDPQGSKPSSVPEQSTDPQGSKPGSVPEPKTSADPQGSKPGSEEPSFRKAEAAEPASRNPMQRRGSGVFPKTPTPKKIFSSPGSEFAEVVLQGPFWDATRQKIYTGCSIGFTVGSTVMLVSVSPKLEGLPAFGLQGLYGVF